MPGYKTHLGFGFAAALITLSALFWYGIYRPAPEIGMVLVALTLVGALTPDVDTDSKGQDFLYAALALIDAALIFMHYYKWAAILGFCAMLPAIGRHRGWTHTWWAMIVVPLPVIAVPVLHFHQSVAVVLPFYIAVVLGYFSHLLLDRRFF